MSLSDHLPLVTTIIVNLNGTPPSKFTKERTIKRGIKLKDIEEILLSPLWPTKPFVFVAQIKGLTSLSKTY